MNFRRFCSASAIAASVLVGACDDAPNDAPDARTTAEASEPVSTAAPLNDEYLPVANFEATYDPESGALQVEMLGIEDWDPADAARLRQAEQSLFCPVRITEGVQNTAVLVTDPGSIFSDGADCGFPAPFPYASLGVFCADVSVEAVGYDLTEVYAQITSMAPNVGYNGYKFPFGNGADPATVSASPSQPTDAAGGLFAYGDVTSNTPVSAQWVFENDGGAFSFRGRVVAAFTETQNGFDDDCDGRVDEETNSYADGSECESGADCISAICDAGVCADTLGDCDPGFFGGLCDQECPGGAANACTSNGTCDDGLTGLGACACDAGFWGAACENACNCDDGLFCNGVETCDAVLGCQAGSAPALDDGVSCTVDSCDEAGDVVVNTATDTLCDDAAFCNGAETCDAALGCQAGTPVVVDDGVSCTADSCDEALDVVVNAASDALCDDAAFCNGAETCDAALGCQAGTLPVLDDGVSCTVDSCDEVGDATTNTPDDASCDDSNECTADLCDVFGGCGSTRLADGTACVSCDGLNCECVSGGCVPEIVAPYSDSIAMRDNDHRCVSLLSGETACRSTRAMQAPTQSTEGGYRKIESNIYGACGLEPSGVVQCWAAQTRFPWLFAPPVSSEGGYVDMALTAGHQYAGSVLCLLEPSGAANCVDSAVGPIALPPSTEGGYISVSSYPGLGVYVVEPSGTYHFVSQADISLDLGPLPGGAPVDGPVKNNCVLLASGTVDCNGDTYTRPSGAFVQLSSGGRPSALDDTGQAFQLFGANLTTFEQNEPGLIGVSGDFALAPDGRLLRGQSNRPAWPYVVNRTPFSEWVGSVYGGCGIDGLGRQRCWGRHAGSEANISPHSFTSMHSLGEDFCSIGSVAVICWRLADGQLQRAFSGASSPIVAVTGDGQRTCVLRQNGAIECASDDPFGNTGITEHVGPFTDFASDPANDALCAIDAAGAIACWGELAGMQPAETGALSIFVRGGEARALFADGTWREWTATQSSQPYDSAGFTVVSFLITTSFRDTVLTSDGEVINLPAGTPGPNQQPLVSDEGGFVELHARHGAPCGVEPSGVEKCDDTSGEPVYGRIRTYAR